ncbi:amidohydrolase family protein [Hespellia stercorisuis]|uniref:Amidohydrolase-related domain-containing protein n=1 Tax=Hespellia stercorisuis DSM 15480 TaxID=1121950 RepID=A0A1M6N1C3_9FIRM|nr:amidohydrolase family protein [Hespellia stercorisuis]SHJ89519.1 hypothetical protein SAMN02745243_01667 [Hespellia stercorisuis DSM 15480]
MIDFHTHIFPEKIAKGTLDFLGEKCGVDPFTNGTASGLSDSTKEAGLDLSVVLPVVTKPKQFLSINEFALQVQSERLLSFGGIHPETSDYKSELNFIAESGLKGIKLHPDYQGTFIDDIKYERIIDRASELGLVVVIHSGYDPGYPELIHCAPSRAAKMLDDVTPEKVVLAHMGGYNVEADGSLGWREMEEYLLGRDVYLDTALVLDKMPKDTLQRIIEQHGSDKILFATDSPWAGQSEFVEYMSTLPIAEMDRQKIFHENAAKLLTL